MSTATASTPRKDGFRMPAEFEPHSRCWMLWPEREDTWRLRAEPARLAFAAVAHAIAEFEPVTVCASAEQLGNARVMLAPRIEVIELPSDDAWMRDIGPTFVVNPAGSLQGVDWDFNAWGGMYTNWAQDARVAGHILAINGIPGYMPKGFILEGGSIHVDGQGTCLTTEECLLNPNRNPHLSRSEIETLLQDYLNLQAIIWLDRGVYLDETSGHVDNLCCFVHAGSVALTWCDDPGDPMYTIVREAYERLQSARDAHGRRLEITRIHQPGPLFMTETESEGIPSRQGVVARLPGMRLAGSYINFYLANGGLVAPVFGDAHDQPALDTLQLLFPERKVVGIPSREILLGGGNIHCITLQQPIACTT